jgi:hypothetical protein
LAGCSGATSTPRACSQGTQAPSLPSRAQLPPPKASSSAPRAGTVCASPGWRVEAQRLARIPAHPTQPAVAHVKAHALRARRRCSQARSSGAAFMSVGKTRCDVPDEGG